MNQRFQTAPPPLLAIDGSQEDLFVLHSILECAGFRALAASSGLEGLALGRSGSPDLILLDLLMPNLHGHEVLRELLADPPRDEGGSHPPRNLRMDDAPGSLSTPIEFLRTDDKALEIATPEHPDVIILDIVMGGMDSRQVCMNLKQHRATFHIPPVFVTVKDAEATQLKGLMPFSLPVMPQRVIQQIKQKPFRNERKRQSVVDRLTGIGNRRHLQLSLGSNQRQSMRPPIPVSAIMMDVNHFKACSDHLCHPAGDACLKPLPRALDGVQRFSTDLLARCCAADFICPLPGMPPEGAWAHAQALDEAVAALKWPHPDSKVAAHPPLSLRVASRIPTPAAPSGQLIEEADRALYAARAAGRNRVIAAAAPPWEDPAPRALSS